MCHTRAQRFRYRSHRSLPAIRRTFVRVTWRPVSGPPVVCFLSSSRPLLVRSKKRHFLSVPPIPVSPSSVKCHSLLYLSCCCIFFDNKLSRPSDPFDTCLFKCISSWLYFASTSSIDFLENNKSARSLARPLQVSFLLSPYCLHLVLVSITLAPVPLTDRRQRTFTSRAAFGRVCGIATTSETPRPTRTRIGVLPISSLRGSDQVREICTDRKKRFRFPRAIDRSLDRYRGFSLLWTFTLGPRRSRDVSSFLFAIVLAVKEKKIKGSEKEEIPSSENLRASFVSLFFFLIYEAQ